MEDVIIMQWRSKDGVAHLLCCMAHCLLDFCAHCGKRAPMQLPELARISSRVSILGIGRHIPALAAVMLTMPHPPAGFRGKHAIIMHMHILRSLSTRFSTCGRPKEDLRT